MRASKIKAKLKRGEPVLVTALVLTDPSLFELTSLMGFDGIWLDLEHHATQRRDGRHADAGRPRRHGRHHGPARQGRVHADGPAAGGRGAGIMYPRCDDAAEAREVVTWSKFAPLGRAGSTAATPTTPYCPMPLGRYVRQANERDVSRDPDRGPGRPGARRGDRGRRGGRRPVPRAGATSACSAASPASSTTPPSRTPSARSPPPDRAGKAWGMPSFSPSGPASSWTSAPVHHPRRRHPDGQERPGVDPGAVRTAGVHIRRPLRNAA